MRKVNEEIVLSVWEALSEICASPRIKSIKVGITHNVQGRFGTYKRHGFRCIAVLESGLTLNEVWKLEKMIHERTSEDKRSAVHRKDTRKKFSYRRSSGGKKIRGPKYSFYVAWL